MSTLSIASASAVEAALGGMHRSGLSMLGAANRVVSGTVDAIGSAGSGGDSNGDTVSLSDVASRIRCENSVEGALLDTSSAGLIYTANARVVSSALETQGSLFDIVA